MKQQGNITQSVLQALVDVTKALCLSVEQGDFPSVAQQLDEREALLNKESSLIADYCAAKGRRVDELRPLLDSLKQVDQELITLFTRKKTEVACEMRLAQNQRRLLAYSR